MRLESIRVRRGRQLVVRDIPTPPHGHGETLIHLMPIYKEVLAFFLNQ